MSIEVMNAVWRHSKSAGRQKLVLLAIADHQGEMGAWPSIATLARMVNASERSVQRDIQNLVAFGELAIEEQAAPTRSQYKTNRYWVTLSGVTDFESGVTNRAVRGDTVVTLNLKEPLLETEHAQNEFEQAFSTFWESYPRKVGKGAARKAFRVAYDGFGEEVLQGAKRLSADRNLPPQEFIPYPATWLNREGWNDEPYPEREKTAEEKQAEAQAIVERRRQADLEHSRRVREEAEEARRRAEANPPSYCEHGRIKVLCRQCPSPKLN